MNNSRFKSLQDMALNKLDAYENSVQDNSSYFDTLQESIQNAVELREEFELVIKKMRELSEHRDNIERLPERIQGLAHNLRELIKVPSTTLDITIPTIDQQSVKLLLNELKKVKGNFSKNILDNFDGLGNDLLQRKEDINISKVELLKKLKTLADRRLADITNELQDSVSDELENLKDALFDAVEELQDKIQTLSEDLISFGTEEITTTLENSAALYDSLADIKQRIQSLFELIGQMMETTNDEVQEAQTGLRLITDILMELDTIMEEIQ